MPSESTSQVEVPLNLQYLPHDICHGTSNQTLWCRHFEQRSRSRPCSHKSGENGFYCVTRFWTMFSSYLEDNNGSHSFQIHESLKDKKVVLLAVPGAFTPTCRWVALEFNCWMSSTFFAQTFAGVHFLRLSKAGWFVGLWDISYNCFATSSTCRASSTML